MFQNTASCAFQQAKREIDAMETRKKFEAMGGQIIDADTFNKPDHLKGNLWLVCRPDETYRTLDDLLGDGYDVDYLVKEEHWPRKQAEEERQSYIDEINQDGIWGYTTHFRDESGEIQDGEWSCWGFIGDNFDNSGYDIDAMNSVMNEYQAAQKTVKDAETFCEEVCNA